MYMLGGDIMFLFLFLVSHCATLAIDLYYEVINDICLLFYVLQNQEFILFYLYFPFMCLYFYRVFQKYTC